ncbi:AAA family ATPase [Ralstonia sp. ASV6]|uniref:AAA family ATPase n=1 Tax=Ralstonia sp. ASV6 TaxID=2795124 RepID=UPI0018EA492A|nr:AAA family ATPase [Ralstonia sp. ASV6]
MDIRLAFPGKTTPDDLKKLANLSGIMLQKIRDDMLQPMPRKVAPMIPSGRLQEICEIDKTRMNRALKKNDLPEGSQARPGAVRYFTLEEAMQWVRAELKPVPRTGPGKVIAVANFKGGVTKTTMSTLLAQGLTLRRGRKVCHVDLDPQGSATTLYGINPHAEISADQTIVPLIEAYLSGNEFNMRQLPLETYWPNLDLIPASTELFNAEFMLPARATTDANSAYLRKSLGEAIGRLKAALLAQVTGAEQVAGLEKLIEEGIKELLTLLPARAPGEAHFEKVLSKGLDQLKDEYDYIILDTAPTLSYLTINAIFAADGVVVPVVPDVLAFSSMVQFWQLFSDLVTGMEERGEESQKEFDFLEILVTRMAQKDAPRLVTEWIREVYGNRVLPIEIPETDLARNSSMRFSTVYDLSANDANAETLRRIRVPCDQFVDYIDNKMSAIWQGR